MYAHFHTEFSLMFITAYSALDFPYSALKKTKETTISSTSTWVPKAPNLPIGLGFTFTFALPFSGLTAL